MPSTLRCLPREAEIRAENHSLTSDESAGQTPVVRVPESDRQPEAPIIGSACAGEHPEHLLASPGTGEMFGLALQTEGRKLDVDGSKDGSLRDGGIRRSPLRKGDLRELRLCCRSGFRPLEKDAILLGKGGASSDDSCSTKPPQPGENRSQNDRGVIRGSCARPSSPYGSGRTRSPWRGRRTSTQYAARTFSCAFAFLKPTPDGPPTFVTLPGLPVGGTGHARGERRFAHITALPANALMPGARSRRLSSRAN